MYSAYLDDLVGVCLGAGEDTELCLSKLAESFSVHSIVAETSFPKFDSSRAERAAYLCDHFPEDYISLCHTNALGRFIRGHIDSRGAMEYCAVVNHQLCDDFFKGEKS